MLKDVLGKRILFFDGGMGTLLQEKGLKTGEFPERWNIERPEAIKAIHRDYIKAGSDIVLANTFGANRYKYGEELESIISAGIKNLKSVIAEEGREVYAALDIGPCGKLIYPSGDLDFDEAYDVFKEICIIGEKNGADLVVIETMGDIAEVRAAVLAAKENTSLPVFCTLIFDEKGRLLTGADVKSAVLTLEALKVDALGANCGLGPKEMAPIVKELLENASVPVIVNPNAGLPVSVDGKTVFNIKADEFSEYMEGFAKDGAWLLGGCCGTTPEFIEKTVALCKDIEPLPISAKKKTAVSSYAKSVEIGNGTVVIGERINPTGKKKFKEALLNNDIDYILREAVNEDNNGADILDVNVGLPGIDEVKVMEEAIREIQTVTDLPLQIDTANAKAMEAALRHYHGKALINSVNGKQESMDTVFPLVKKYGGVVVGLTLDESGIPETAEGRFAVAQKIVKEALKYGIPQWDIIIDPLTMTISTDGNNAKITLEALKMIKERLGVKTVLGVSNISFGLPNREKINTAFFTMAMAYGLDAGIINPASEAMMNAVINSRALLGFDEGCAVYIEKNSEAETAAVKTSETDLKSAVKMGLKDEAAQIAKALLDGGKAPLDVINEFLIPALDEVGKDFENGKVFLPKLLMSAVSAGAAFDEVKAAIEAGGTAQEKKGKILLATVKGDIHDIGKNIVKTLLENYGYDVLDLGRDVAPEKVVEAAVKEDINLVGLSALMTTTVVNMEETIRLLKAKRPECKIMVGGAVLTKDYAESIGADFYGKDAMASVGYAKEVL
ncbi:MAG: homocysteine S-methyltransferase family protein [Firmicutes bacterium]|nr:homocysteine S-methyltransferase family protein [Bacillota bacterium]